MSAPMTTGRTPALSSAPASEPTPTTDLDACAGGWCGHYHPTPAPDDPLLDAERRVRDRLRDLEEAVHCLPADHLLRRQWEAGELYTPWRTRAHALLWRIGSEQRSWQRVYRVLRGWAP